MFKPAGQQALEARVREAHELADALRRIADDATRAYGKAVPLCDRLEAALTTANTTRARLLESLIHEALEPTADAVTEAAE